MPEALLWFPLTVLFFTVGEKLKPTTLLLISLASAMIPAPPLSVTVLPEMVAAITALPLVIDERSAT